MRPDLVRHDPEHVDPSLVAPEPRLEEPVLQGVGPDQPEPGAGRAVDRRPGPQEHRQALPRVVASDEHDLVQAPLGVRLLGQNDSVRDDLEAGPEPARRRLGRHPGHGDPRVDAFDQESPHLEPGAHPAEIAGGVPGGDDRALRERQRRHADRGGHRLVQVEHVEALLAQRLAHAEDRPGRENDVRQGAVRRDDDRATDRDDPRRQVAVAAAPGVQETRHRSRWVVTHQDPDVVAAVAQGVRLVFGMLHDAAPVRPREGDDDADLHAYAASSTGASRATPSSKVSSTTASERRAQPAPLGPNPSPGASTTRCSTSRRSGDTPAGSLSHT